MMNRAFFPAIPHTTDKIGRLRLPCALVSVLLVLFAISSVGYGEEFDSNYARKGAAELEKARISVQGKLNRLAQYSLRSGVGSIGYRSIGHAGPNNREWFQVDFDAPHEIDTVILVPCLLRDSVAGFRAEGFPKSVRIVVIHEGNETIVARMDADQGSSNRIAPVVLSFDPLMAESVRIESDQLTSRQFDGAYLLQFAEVLVFSGNDNVAQNQSPQTSSDDPSGSPAWGRTFAVDGFVPYLMHVPGKSQSLALVGTFEPEEQPEISFDLGSEFELTRVNLHLVDQADTVPQTFSGDFGVPHSLIAEGALSADFLDAKVLFKYEHTNAYDAGPFLSRRFPPTLCRYVRVKASGLFVVDDAEPPKARLGFAEIEIIADGKNVALGIPPTASFSASEPRTLAALTDGQNYYGQILPLKSWLQQLATRHDLESAMPQIDAALAQRYQQQSINLNRLIWVAMLLGVGICTTVAIGWALRQRAVYETRERIAADLHDELGANIHAIGLLSDLTQNAVNSPDKMKNLLQRMRELTQRAGKAASYCSNMLESTGLFDSLEFEMRKSSARILADHNHDLTIDDQQTLERLPDRSRIDLFLFYKECLTNILRHSGADDVKTHLVAKDGRIRLTIRDNGVGLAKAVDLSHDGVPTSLKRRARLLGGKVSAEGLPNGTQIELSMRVKKKRFLI